VSVPVKLPALGESVVEGTVSRWLVAEGDRVGVDQPLCEVTTDKVDAEIPAPVSGVIERILAPEDTVVEVGAELATIAEQAVAVTPESSDEALVEAAATSVFSESILATPVARRLAERADLPLREIQGSGSAGRVTKSDVLSHRAAPVERSGDEGRERVVAAPTPALSQLQIDLEEGDRIVPMSPQRRLIAAHMVYSKRTSPHVGTVAEIDLAAVEALRKGHAERFRAQHGTSLTLLPFVGHVLVRALRKHPALNASVCEDAIVERSGFHLAVAVETEKGLLAPVVRNADRLSLTGLALAVADLSDRARRRKLGPDELRGGTFTVSNPGRMGNLYGFAIINQPQVGILRMGTVVKRPVVREVEGLDAIVISPQMHLALSYDHRAVDGASANAFLYYIREELEAGSFDL
jgi:2-oxoglutarate dehydrogenase E2 component (dihydrolipoamide succinyltransferase)